MTIENIQTAKESYGIKSWGNGYFNINDHGEVTVHPTGLKSTRFSIKEMVDWADKHNISSPYILRFPQMIEKQMDRLVKSFQNAIWEYSYPSKHKCVFPMKVNQEKSVLDTIVDYGKKYHYGLEVGSKPELIAALNYDLSDGSLLICNGFKDAEFINLTFLAQQMGFNVIVVVEGPDELQMIINESKKYPEKCPEIGIRAKLYSRGSGKWQKSSGKSSKFGLTTSEILQCIELLDKNNLTAKLTMLHFHIGSQITQIKRIKNAMKEASRVYAKCHHLGCEIKYLNVGGGLGVDYDGSNSSFQYSANYSMQEFANDIVFVIGEICKSEQVPPPTIVTESGRVIVAYHSMLVTDIREVQGEQSVSRFDYSIIDNDSCTALKELKYCFERINEKNCNEFYHDALEYHEELFTLFNLGYLSLEEKALAEELYSEICSKAFKLSSSDQYESDEYKSLHTEMQTKFLANFSIFQSIPDCALIDQMFPIMPIDSHELKPNHRASIVDITCDSDGCLDKFIDTKEIKNHIEIFKPKQRTFYLAFFLLGAYQESLSSEHNLFCKPNVLSAKIIDDKLSINLASECDKVSKILTKRKFNIDSIYLNITSKLEVNECPPDQIERWMQTIYKACCSSPYLQKRLLD